MNIDDRIEQLKHNSFPEDNKLSWYVDPEDVKQLIRDVLEEVKPQKFITYDIRATGDKSTVRLFDLAEMEAKIKELGL